MGNREPKSPEDIETVKSCHNVDEAILEYGLSRGKQDISIVDIKAKVDKVMVEYLLKIAKAKD